MTDQPLDLTLYDEYSRRYEKAFDAHRITFEKRNPPPSIPVRPVAIWLNVVAILFVTAAAIIVSASRTVEEFSGDGANANHFVGLAGFVMADIGMIVITFNRTRLNRSGEEKINQSRRNGLLAALAMAVILLAANINHELSLGADFDRGLKLILAISAPLMSMVFGEMLAVEIQRVNNRYAQELNGYRLLLEDWNRLLLEDWEANQSRMQATFKAPKVVRPSSPKPSNGQSNGLTDGLPPSNGQPLGLSAGLTTPALSSAGHRKSPKASEIAKEYLLAHPHVLEMDAAEAARTLIEGAGKDERGKDYVGRSTAFSVLAKMRAEVEEARPVVSVEIENGQEE